ncbi:MAG: hypothetical protein HY984_02385, partial [Candidatus Magasanikbacteria bacterium]|nr:hypothetical protein [Candidatus Magasanikbacteria bacterium]
YCGDTKINGPEECDNGNKNGARCIPDYEKSCSYCSDECSVSTVVGAYCGDGKTNGPEECDTLGGKGTGPKDQWACTQGSYANGGCRWTGGYMGDGQLNGGENCDCGSISPSCTTGYGQTLQNCCNSGVGVSGGVNRCINGRLANINRCGDGQKQCNNEQGQCEQCDDGNSTNGDGCDTYCHKENNTFSGNWSAIGPDQSKTVDSKYEGVPNKHGWITYKDSNAFILDAVEGETNRWDCGYDGYMHIKMEGGGNDWDSGNSFFWTNAGQWGDDHDYCGHTYGNVYNWGGYQFKSRDISGLIGACKNGFSGPGNPPSCFDKSYSIGQGHIGTKLSITAGNFGGGAAASDPVKLKLYYHYAKTGSMTVSTNAGKVNVGDVSAVPGVQNANSSNAQIKVWLEGQTVYACADANKNGQCDYLEF